MLEYYLIYFVRFAASGQSSQATTPPASSAATANGTPSSSSATTVAGTPVTPRRSAAPSSSSSSTPAASSSSSTPYNLGIGGVNRYSYSSRGPYGEQVYLHLFQSYAKRYLPHVEPMMPATAAAASTSSSHGKRVPRPPVRSYADLDRDAEFFLRLVLELWLDGGAAPLSLIHI